MSAPKWPGVQASTEEVKPGEWECTMSTTTKYDKELTEKGKATTRSPAVANARDKLRRAVQDSEAAYVRKALKKAQRDLRKGK